ncbi:MAG: hypothetical protein SGPRY_006438, partial [Prymnesium sp.]
DPKTGAHHLSPELAQYEPRLVQYLPRADLSFLLSLRQQHVSLDSLRALSQLIESALTWESSERCVPCEVLPWVIEQGIPMSQASLSERGSIYDEEMYSV